MPRKPDPTLKPAILEKVTLHLLDTKLEDVSVRSLGRILGTSAYPIVYHFGSRDALIDSVVVHLADTVCHAALDPAADRSALADYLVTSFGRLDDPHRALAARLTFELGSVEAMDSRVRQRGLHRDHVAAVAAWCLAHGYDAEAADRVARDAVTTARGAQWTAIVDRERADTDAALRAIADRLAAGAAVTAG
ncbi:hypothetical protein [Curtobacterium sp. PhB78]|uniref:hypothetical protein n=1 Tax=Curtobacterium sp. PhB78 TaxID=2485102 RepID=UPI000F47A483|nr:hypothetical protein [Curtobacterium sp. PhB78]ROS47482.1 TetR family transcriptional regulator [Curtobacterium sp. PhB78]